MASERATYLAEKLIEAGLVQDEDGWTEYLPSRDRFAEIIDEELEHPTTVFPQTV